MRAILIVPVHKIRQLLAERLLAKWYDNNACTFLLEAQDESFNNRDTPVLADSAEARCDPVAITPILEHVRPAIVPLRGCLFGWVSVNAGTAERLVETRSRVPAMTSASTFRPMVISMATSP